jgi:WD40 repeat protein
MAPYRTGSFKKKNRSAFLSFLFIASLFLPMALAADSDGDGVQDSSDDCPWAAGTSTVDKDGCPDRDGDGTSDFNDGWSIGNPNFQNEFTTSSSNDYYGVAFSPNGEFIVTGSEDDFVRIWNASTWTNVRSVNTGTNVNGVDFSPDGQYVAAALDDDTIGIYYSSNLTSIHGVISVDVGGGDQVNSVAFSPDSSSVAVAIGRSGNGGTNGEVAVINVITGTELYAVNPNGEDRFYDLAWSPDGMHMALAGNGDIYIVNTTTRATTWTITNPPAAVNAIAWSPDGNYISMCGGWEGQSASFDMYEYGNNAWTRIWEKVTTTSCASTTFSSDGSQVIAGMHWYQADGATARVYQSDTGTQVDSFSGPRPGGCTSGNNNNCGTVYGVAWSPDSTHIVTAHGRNDEGVYYWFADIDADNDGYNTTDQGDGVVDIFPEDGTQWNDTDGDGFGDNPSPANEPDSCPIIPGTSNKDRFGCPDGDGDGWSDAGDWAPADVKQWADSDSDGYGDNYYFDLNEYQLHLNQSGDAFPNDATQWNDSDGDGYGDNYDNVSWETQRPSFWPGLLLSSANQPDAFPLERSQYLDSDGDWVGDNPNSDRPDGCPYTWGDSIYDRLGCADTDGDGYSDPTPGWPATTDCYGADAFPNDITQWCDEDNDGFGSNATGNNSDDCPSDSGTSSVDRRGCPDRDGDGYSNAGDPFPDDATQWADRDGDNRGDNPNGTNADAFPDDTSQWKDTDGDGYGDNPGGNNGDAFWNDVTQWADEDGDGFGDNTDGTNGDVCPTEYGESNNENTRGCPDTDLDGYEDKIDAFPEDPFQWTDTDGDGYGDNTNVPSGDDCVDVPGTSFEMARQGCPDADGDGYADVDDAFPNDADQYLDTDGDGYGDNYFFVNETIADKDNPGAFLILRNQSGDAFPNIVSQWSDVDGDGWGDNLSSFNRVDNFPYQSSQWNDFDGDGYGDNTFYTPLNSDENATPVPAFRPDECAKEPGTSTVDVFGCVDSDGDGVSDLNDPCVWDPEIFEGARSIVTCGIKSDPSITNNGDEDSDSLLSGNLNTLTLMGGAIIFLLALIFVAQLAKTAGKRRAVQSKRDEQMVHDAFGEEEERRLAWVQHYLAEGNYAEARALGWEGDEIPEWKRYEMQQQAGQEAAIPTMLSLDDVL